MFALVVSSLLGLAAPGRAPAAPAAAPEGASSATVVVSLPADATLTIGGSHTKSTGGVRSFITPSLRPGQEYTYTFKAEFVRQGQTITVAQEVPVWAGRQTDVSLGLPRTAAAAVLPQSPPPTGYPVYDNRVSQEEPRAPRRPVFDRWEPHYRDPFSWPHD